MFLKPLLPALLWALFILIICGIPGDQLPRLDFLDWLRPDKLVHLFIFGLLCYLLISGFLKQDAISFLKSNPKFWAIIFSVVYGVIIEILQEYLFIHRTGDIRDAIADAIGAFIGLWCFNFVMKKRLSRKSSSS